MSEGFWAFNSESFEDFTRTLALKVFGPGVTVFGDGPDGGREATFDGHVPFPYPPSSEWNGYGVIQAKCKGRSENAEEDQKWALQLLASELQKFVDGPRRTRKPQYFVFVTNVALSSAVNGGIDKANQLCNSFYNRLPLLGHDVWDRNKLHVLLKANPDLRLTFSEALIPGDALALLIGVKSFGLGKLSSVATESTKIAGDLSNYAKAFAEQATAMGLMPTAGQKVNAGIDSTYSEIPPPIAEGSRREESVALVSGHFATAAWVALHGDPSLGKTQLANRLTEGHPKRKWISFKEMDAQTAHSLLHNVLNESASLPNLSFAEQSAEFFMPIAGTFLILDDLPRMNGGDGLSSDLTVLATEAKRAGCRLISTSLHRLPLTLSASLKGVLAEISSPSFTAKESGELFSAIGMPVGLLSDARKTFLCGLAKGHPLLLIGIANHLKSINWRFDEQSVADLLQGAHSDRVADDVMPKLLRTVPDSARELLQRISLIRGGFNDSYVDALAEVTPKISRPREQLQYLLGFCVQRDSGNRLRVAAVFDNWISRDLDSNVKTQCHAAIGEKIVSEGRLDQWSGFNAVVHLFAGGEFNKAALIFISGLQAFDSALRKDKQYSTTFAMLWSDQPLPETMNAGLRLTIRGLQISVFHELGKDTRWLASDLLKLLKLAGSDDSLPAFASIFQACDAIAASDPDLGFDLLSRGFASVQVARSYLKTKGHDFPSEAKPELMAFIAVGWIRGAGHLDKWMAGLTALTSEQRERLRYLPGASDCFLSAANRLWLNESERPAKSQNWQVVQDEFARSAKNAKTLGLELLWAALIRSAMIVRAEYQGQLDASIRFGQESLKAASSDPDAQFLLKEAIGRQFYFAGKTFEASPWLLGALEQQSTVFPLTRALAYAYASVTDATASPKTLELMNSAVELMREIANRSRSLASERLELVKLLCEKSEIEWSLNKWRAAYLSLEEAEEILYRMKPTAEWKEVAVLFCHLIGYLRAIATTGSPPTIGFDGGSYAAPQRGVFLSNNPDRATLHSDLRDKLRYLAFADLADSIGEFDKAVKWANKGLETASQRGPSWTVGHLAWYPISEAIESGNFLEASEKLEMAAKYCAASQAKHALIDDDLNAYFDPDEVLKTVDSEILAGWRGYMTLPLIVGMTFRIGIAAVEDDNSFEKLLKTSVSLCRRQANNHISPDLWRAAEEVFQAIANPESTGPDLIKLGNEHEHDDMKVIRIAAYLGGTIRQRGEPGDAMTAHLAIFPFIHKYLRMSIGIYRLGLKFLDRYWNYKLEKAPFLFRSPRLVAQELIDARAKPPSVRAQLMLASIAKAFDKQIDPRAQEWLRSL